MNKISASRKCSTIRGNSLAAVLGERARMRCLGGEQPDDVGLRHHTGELTAFGEEDMSKVLGVKRE